MSEMMNQLEHQLLQANKIKYIASQQEFLKMLQLEQAILYIRVD